MQHLFDCASVEAGELQIGCAFDGTIGRVRMGAHVHVTVSRSMSEPPKLQEYWRHDKNDV